jgi:amino acid permease
MRQIQKVSDTDPGAKILSSRSDPANLDSSKKSKKFIKPGGVKSTTINLLISTLGPGMVTLPTAFLMSGIFGGFIWFVLATIISWMSIYCLYSAANRTNKFTYGELSEYITKGRKMSICSEIVFILNNCGTAISYMILVIFFLLL